MVRSLGFLLFGFVLGSSALAQGSPPILWVGAGHVDDHAVAVSPDGLTLATASYEDDTIKLWRVSDGAFLRTLQGAYTGINGIAFTPDGQFIASGGDNAFGSGQADVLLWRVSDGAIVRQFFANSLGVYGVAVSPDGQLLAAGDQNYNAWIWRLSDAVLLHTPSGLNAGEFTASIAPTANTGHNHGGDYAR